jgi:cysteine synthase
MDAPVVVEIIDERVVRDGPRLFTTLEGHNPSGSIKDHMVLGELTELLNSGRVKSGDRVSEVSAGSTASSLAHYCREMGLACDLFVPDTLPKQQIADLKALGADVRTGSGAQGYALYEEFCARAQPHRFEQLTDHSLLRHYEALGAAIEDEVGPIDTVMGSVGTGHSLLGIAAAISPAPFVASAEPAEANAIPGVRNVELERFGPQDACTPEMFDLRLVLSAGERRDFGPVLTNRGEMWIGLSFALVLSAVERLLALRRTQRVFLVGAENHISGSVPRQAVRALTREGDQ